MFAVLFALRNNILTAFFSISYERAIYFHKCAGILVPLLAALHGVSALLNGFGLGDKKTQSGIVLFVFMVLSAFSYLLKNYLFEWFYYFHLASYGILVICGVVHGASTLSLTAIAWLLDVAFRYYFRAHKVEATLELLPAKIVRIRCPNTFAYSPGQYCFIKIPALSNLQFHVSANDCCSPLPTVYCFCSSVLYSYFEIIIIRMR
jgi:predicted ferric reductase